MLLFFQHYAATNVQRLGSSQHFALEDLSKRRTASQLLWDACRGSQNNNVLGFGIGVEGGEKVLLVFLEV